MGLDIYSAIVVGVRVRQEDLFDHAGIYSACERGHEQQKGANYCQVCGARVGPKEQFAAKPAFAAYAASIARDPMELWQERGWAEEKMPAVHCIDQSYGSKGVHFAVGMRACETESSRFGDRAPRSINALALPEIFVNVVRVATDLGLLGPVELFTVTRISE